MHDAFSPVEEDQEMATAAFDEQLLLPCAVMMSANVGLFLCDALSLTVTPLLRPDVSTQRLPHLPRAEAFVAAGPDDLDAARRIVAFESELKGKV